VAIDRHRELIVLANSDLFQAFIQCRVFDEDRGLVDVVKVVE